MCKYFLFFGFLLFKITRLSYSDLLFFTSTSVLLVFFFLFLSFVLCFGSFKGTTANYLFLYIIYFFVLLLLFNIKNKTLTKKVTL